MTVEGKGGKLRGEIGVDANTAGMPQAATPPKKSSREFTLTQLPHNSVTMSRPEDVLYVWIPRAGEP